MWVPRWLQRDLLHSLAHITREQWREALDVVRAGKGPGANHLLAASMLGGHAADTLAPPRPPAVEEKEAEEGRAEDDEEEEEAPPPPALTAVGC